MYLTLYTRGPIVYFIVGSVRRVTEVLHLVGAIMEHFLEGSTPLLNSEENICIQIITLFFWVNVPMLNVVMDPFLQGNVPLRHQNLLKEETLFMS